MANPSEIKEGAVVYSLGELHGNRVEYDFKKILVYLEAKGKLLFDKKFKIYEEDHEILYKLCNYAIRDFGTCRKLGIDPNKGILLSGPVGCGKTSLMKLLRHLTPHFKPYQVMPSRNIVFAFKHVGFRVIQDYGDSQFYCFDDLGLETTGRYFGQDCNVMGEILLSRHDLFTKTGLRTHATTNQNAQELEERYGERVRSRMRQQFNLIAFPKDTKDKRR